MTWFLRRQCRVACMLLLSSILPLLAQDEASKKASTDPENDNNPHNMKLSTPNRGKALSEPSSSLVILKASETLLEDESLASLPTLPHHWLAETTDSHIHRNAVIPFRPPEPYPQQTFHRNTGQNRTSSSTNDSPSNNTATMNYSSVSLSTDTQEETPHTKEIQSPVEETIDSSPNVEPANDTADDHTLLEEAKDDSDTESKKQEDVSEKPIESTTEVDVDPVPKEPGKDQPATAQQKMEETTGDVPDSGKPVAPVREVSEGEKEEKQNEDEKHLIVDYAEKSAGAQVIEKSAGWQGTSNLLTKNNDQYSMIPISASNKYLVISLSEEILVKQVVLANYERYSSHVHEFSLEGSQTTSKWVDLGNYVAEEKNGRQAFSLSKPAWARYLKFRFLSHYGDEHYMTLTQISVHGTTMQQGFQEHWDETSALDEADDAEEHHDEVPPTNEGGDKPVVNSTSSDGAGVDSGDVHQKKEPRESTIENFLAAEILNIETSCVSLDKHGFLKRQPDAHPKVDADCQTWSVLETLCSRKSTEKQTDRFSYAGAVLEPSILQFDRQTRNDGTENTAVFSTRDLSDMKYGGGRFRHRPLELPSQSAFLTSAAEEIRRNTTPNKLAPNASSTGGSMQQESADVPKATTNKLPKAAGVAEKKEKPVKEESINTEEPAKVTAESSESLATLSTPVMAALVARVPSASCLEKLSIDQLKSKLSLNRNVAPGNMNGAPSGAGTEPIFKKLTVEIKALQASLTVHERYAKESLACFERVLLDLFLLQEQQNTELLARLAELETNQGGGATTDFFSDKVLPMSQQLTAILTTFVKEMIDETHFSNSSFVSSLNQVSEMNEQVSSRTALMAFSLFFLIVVLRARRRKAAVAQ